MEQESKEAKEAKDADRVSKAISITKEELAEYFRKFEHDYGEFACPLCKHKTWVVTSRPDDADHPAILTFPIPLVHGRGMWVFPVICQECGFVASFAANKVALKIKGE